MVRPVTHLVVALWRVPDADVGAVTSEWAQIARRDTRVRTRGINVAVADQARFARGDPVDVLITLEVLRASRVADVPGIDVLGEIARRLDVWHVEPHHAIVSSEPAPLVMVSFVERAEHLSRDEFARHWTQQHAPLARRHHQGLADYTQHVVRQSLTPGGTGIDGIAELRFRSREDFEVRFYDSDEGREVIREDVQRFIARPSNLAALMREQRYDFV
jgi:uncharacterized protein (TIGR02118 family)